MARVSPAVGPKQMWTGEPGEKFDSATLLRYQNGAATGSDVLECEFQKVRAARNHLHAQFDAILARLRLAHATGELDAIPVIALDKAADPEPLPPVQGDSRERHQ